MSEYHITWSIELEAASPEEAAKKALEIQRDPTSIATVFYVAGPDDGESQTIDAGYTA